MSKSRLSQYSIVNYNLSAIETFICHTENEFERVYLFRFAQNSLHDFQNTVYELVMVLSSTKERIFPLRAPVSIHLLKYLAHSLRAPPD